MSAVQSKAPSRKIGNIFLTPDPQREGKRRLRAGWRIAGQLILLVVISLLYGLLVVGLGWFNSANPLMQQAIGMGSSLIGVTLAVYLARRWFDRRSFVSLGLAVGGRAGADLLVGFLIAGGMMFLIFLLEWLAGWLTLAGVSWRQIGIWETVRQTTIMLAVFISVGWYEELQARGYWLQNLTEGLNLTWGVLISSGVFALAHLFNPNFNPLAMVGIFLAGLFLAFAYLRTRQLWLPIGLHIGWNFFEGTVFGFPVSGLEMFRLLQPQVNGPELFTGGAFGPEAGLVLLPALALGFLLVNLYGSGRET